MFCSFSVCIMTCAMIIFNIITVIIEIITIILFPTRNFQGNPLWISWGEPEASWVGGQGARAPLASEIQKIFGYFRTLYQLRMCVMTSCDLNVSVRRNNIKLCPPIESLLTTPLWRAYFVCNRSWAHSRLRHTEDFLKWHILPPRPVFSTKG